MLLAALLLTLSAFEEKGIVPPKVTSEELKDLKISVLERQLINKQLEDNGRDWNIKIATICERVKLPGCSVQQDGTIVAPPKEEKKPEVKTPDKK